MASEKQEEFIRSLFDGITKLAPTLDGETQARVAEQLKPFMQDIANVISHEDITAGRAKLLIPLLMEVKKDITPITENVRWKKIGNDWLISGHKSLIVKGQTVTVTSKKGTQEVVVGRIHSVDGDNILAHPKKEDLGNAVTETGFYWKDSKIIEAYHTKKGFLVAREITEEGKKGEYLGVKGLSGLGDKLTLEEVQEFGRKTITCLICGTALEDEESRSFGVGPICRAKI